MDDIECMDDSEWVVSIGTETGNVTAPDPVEAATRYLETLRKIKPKFGIGLLVKVSDPIEMTTIFLKSDVILANAGMYSQASSIKELYPKKLDEGNDN